MILGIDLRGAACGWSLLDEAASSFTGLGVHTLGRPERIDRATLGRMDTVHGLARVIAARAPGCSTIVVERWVPEAMRELDAGLAWGTLLGVASMLTPRPQLLTLEPQAWQRELALGRRDLLGEVAYANAQYVLRGHPRADEALRRLPANVREPAIAAAMIALQGALRLAKSKRAGEG